MRRIINVLVPVLAAAITALITLGVGGKAVMACGLAAAASVLAGLVLYLISRHVARNPQMDTAVHNALPSIMTSGVAAAVAIALVGQGAAGPGGTFRFGNGANIVVEGDVSDLTVSGNVNNLDVAEIGSMSVGTITTIDVETIDSIVANVISKVDAKEIGEVSADTIKSMVVKNIEQMSVDNIESMEVSNVENMEVENVEQMVIDYVENLTIDQVSQLDINHADSVVIGGEKVDVPTNSSKPNGDGDGNGDGENPNINNGGSEEEKPNIGGGLDGNKKPGTDDLDASHTHKWSTKWSSDEDYHWKECVKSGCDKISSKAKHETKTKVVEATTAKEGYELTTCKTCGYEISKKVLPKLEEQNNSKVTKVSYDVPSGNFCYGTTYTIGVLLEGAKEAPKDLKVVSNTTGLKIEKISELQTTDGLKLFYNVTFPASGSTGYYKFTVKSSAIESVGECILPITT